MSRQPPKDSRSSAAAAAAADFRGRLLQPPPLHPSFGLSPFHPPQPPPGPPPGAPPPPPPVGPPATTLPHPLPHFNHEQLFGGFGDGGRGGGGVGGVGIGGHLEALKLKSEVAAAALKAVTTASPFAAPASQDNGDVKGNVFARLPGPDVDM